MNREEVVDNMTEEMVAESVFDEEDILVHPTDEYGRNTQRLSASNDISTLIEIAKNQYEHGNKLCKYYFAADRIVFYNNMKDSELKKMNFLTFSDHLESFKIEDGHDGDRNFHEGTSTYQRFHFLIECGKLFTESRKSPDGYYQYVKRASHVVRIKDHKRVALLVREGEYVDGWRVTIFLEPERVEEMKKILLETLGYFYFAPESNYSITINDAPYSIKEAENWDEMFGSKRNQNGLWYYHLEPGNANATVKIYWRLNNSGIIQYIPGFRQLNDLGVKGSIILTSIHQFANENRIELNKDVFQDISRVINAIVERQIKDKETKDQVRVKYPYFKETYTDYFANLFNIRRDKIYDILWADGDQETTLIKMTQFIYTLNELFGKSKEYKDIVKCETFIDPNNRSDEMMEIDEFLEMVMLIGSTMVYLRNKFAGIYMGQIIIQGEVDGSFFLGDIFRFIQEGILLVINTSIVRLDQVGNFDNSLPLLYPNAENFKYYIADLEISEINNASGYREKPVKFHEISALNKFAVRKGEKPTQDPTVEYPASIDASAYSDGNPSDDSFRLSNYGQDYYLGTIRDDSIGHGGTMPFFFLSAEELRTGRVGKFTPHFSYKRYRVIMKAVELLILNHPAFPDKCIYPVLYSDKRDPTRRVLGWYCKSNGIFAINIAWIDEGKEAAQYVNQIILDTCHELTHEFVPGHGQKFTRVQQEFLEIAYSISDKKTKQRIQDLVEKEIY
jgi:hypothetical protein